MQLKSDLAKECGLENWYLLVRKDYEWYVEDLDEWKNFFLLTVCPKEKLLKTVEEYNQLGYLPICGLTQGLDYWCYFYVTGPRKTKYYENLLTFIGNFKDAKEPFDSRDYKKTIPVGGVCVFNEDFSEGVSYLEKFACGFYKNYGVIHGLDDLINFLRTQKCRLVTEEQIERLKERLAKEKPEIQL